MTKGDQNNAYKINQRPTFQTNTIAENLHQEAKYDPNSSG